MMMRLAAIPMNEIATRDNAAKQDTSTYYSMPSCKFKNETQQPELNVWILETVCVVILINYVIIVLLTIEKYIKYN